MANPAVPGQQPAPTPGVPGQVHRPTVVAAQPAPAQAAPGQPAPAQAVPAPAAEGAEGEGKAKKKVAKTKTGVARPRLARPDDNYVITVFRPNAKTGKSGQRFDQVHTGMTVKQYVDLMTKEPFNRTVGQAYFTLRWDSDPNRKLINIGPEVVPIPEQPPKEPKQPKQPKQEAPQAAK
jgi:hypothetical protein